MAPTLTTLAFISAAATVASTVGSFVQDKAEQKQDKKQADAQAVVSEQQAARERQVAGENEADFRKSQRRAAAAIRAAGGARGIDISVGSPLLTAEDFARETDVQALRIREGGEIRATRLDQQADLLRGSVSSSNSRGLIKAGSSLLSGAVRTASILRG